MLGGMTLRCSRREDAWTRCRDTLRGMFSARLHRLSTWMILAIMVMAALQPAIAHAWRAAHGGAHWVQVCSTSGMFWVRTDAAASPATDESGPSVPGSSPMASAGQCPICIGHGAASLPPLTGTLSVLSPTGFAQALARPDGPPDSPLFRPSSRGPPAA